MKRSEPHLKLTWKFGLSLRFPACGKALAKIATQIWHRWFADD